MVLAVSVVLFKIIFPIASVSLCASFVGLVIRIVPLMVAPVVHSLCGRITEGAISPLLIVCLVLLCRILSAIQCSVPGIKIRGRMNAWVPCHCDFLQTSTIKYVPWSTEVIPISWSVRNGHPLIEWEGFVIMAHMLSLLVVARAISGAVWAIMVPSTVIPTAKFRVVAIPVMELRSRVIFILNICRISIVSICGSKL